MHLASTANLLRAIGNFTLDDLIPHIRNVYYDRARPLRLHLVNEVHINGYDYNGATVRSMILRCSLLLTLKTNTSKCKQHKFTSKPTIKCPSYAFHPMVLFKQYAATATDVVQVASSAPTVESVRGCEILMICETPTALWLRARELTSPLSSMQ
jgi:hypothetical protein